MSSVDYLVYIRFEDGPTQARRHVMAAEQAGGSQYVLDSRYQATPGEEQPILHEAFDAAFGLDKYITLYRGFPVGEDFRGRKLFTPVGLVWCKDRIELGQMLGLEMSYEMQEPFQSPTQPVQHPDEPMRSPWSQGGAKGVDWSRTTQSQDAYGEGHDRIWGGDVSDGGRNSALSDDTLAGTIFGTRRNPVVQHVSSREANAVPGPIPVTGSATSDAPRPGSVSRPTSNDAPAATSNHPPAPSTSASSMPRQNIYAANSGEPEALRRVTNASFDRDFHTPTTDATDRAGASGDRDRDRNGDSAKNGDRAHDRAHDRDRAASDGEPKRGGWWKWLLGFIICLVGSFLIVYGGARLLAG